MNSGLRELFVPASVEIIGDTAFDDCHFLQRIEFERGSALREIGYRAFSCTMLEPGLVRFPPAAKVSEHAFDGQMTLYLEQGISY